ncbi:MAG: hypothetical protein Q9195_004133 [Heterodermia aff. obscurata]
MVQNKGLIFKSVPTGWPKPGDNLAVEDTSFDPESSPPENGITTKNYYLSFDPYQRGRMRAPEKESYSTPFELGKPITNSGVARVLQSNNSKFKEGDLITGRIGTEEYSVISAEVANNMCRKLENPHKLDPKLFIGALGMPGLTAYSSLYEIGKPKKGETIFISAASGAVGQIVGQLAKHEGLTVIGSVGSDEKLAFMKKELKFDDGFNYKTEKARDALARLAPNGIDIYFENVGGEQLEAAIGAMNNFGRIVACGMISQYNVATPDDAFGVKNLSLFIRKRLTMRGFIVSDPDMGPKYAAEHQEKLQKWIGDGSFIAKQSITDGIDNAVAGFLGMLKGENFGKSVLTISELEEKASQ